MKSSRVTSNHVTVTLHGMALTLLALAMPLKGNALELSYSLSAPVALTHRPPPLPNSATDLAAAVQAGLAIHPAVRASQSEMEWASTEVGIARNGYLPSLSLSAGPKNLNAREVVYDATVSQMVFDWGRTKSKVDQAAAAHEQRSASALVARDDAALDIVETYLNTLLAERRLQAVRLHLDDLGEIQSLTKARGQNGYSDRSEMDRANLEVTRVRELLAMEQGSLQEARNQYRVLVGEDPQALTEPAPPSMAHYLTAHDLPYVIQQSPLYQRSVKATAEAEAELRQTKAAQLPQLNLEVSALRREIGGRLENDAMIALRFRMDTLQGMSSFQRPTAAQKRLEAAQWNQEAMQRDISRKLRNLADAGETLQWREDSLRNQVSESGEVIALYREQFGIGRRDVIDLLNAQRERFDAISKLETLRIERLRITYRSAAQLGLLNDLLENRLNGS